MNSGDYPYIWQAGDWPDWRFILERTQKQSMDVTEWLAWFLDTLHRAVVQAQHTLDAVLIKALLAVLGDHTIERATGETPQSPA